MNSLKPYPQFINELKNEIRASQYLAYRTSNSLMIQLYWSIGKQIAAKQKELGWGKSVIDRMSSDLRAEFDASNSFSPDNLQRMRQFYVEYTEFLISGQAVPKLDKLLSIASVSKHTISGQAVPKIQNIDNQNNQPNNEWENNIKQIVLLIPWGHNLLIMKKCSSIEERLYYIENTFRFAWKRENLLNQIKSQAFERGKGKSDNNFDKALPNTFAEQANDAMKSIYSLEFLNMQAFANERELENKLVENIKQFLLELGYGFCFIGQQYRLVLDEKEYFIDLLFYHRFLKALVAIELKTTEFTPEHAGKMDFYLNLLNLTEKAPDDNPSIGIILCAERNQLEVEFSVKTKQNPIGVAEYQLTKTLPKKYEGKLPTSKDLTQFISMRTK